MHKTKVTRCLSHLSSQIYGMVFLGVFVTLSVARAEQTCYYEAAPGQFLSIQNKNEVPKKDWRKVRCTTTADAAWRLDTPDRIELEGSERERTVSTPIGRMSLRWARTAAKFFRSRPEHAVKNAARAVSSLLRSEQQLDSRLNLRSLPWKIVILDQHLSKKGIPAQLVTNCHPAWMTPPANLYVVGQRLAQACSNFKTDKKTTDVRLTEALLHEIGHVVENQLIKRPLGPDKTRSEGFATWFEGFAARKARGIRSSSVSDRHRELAAVALRRNPKHFVFDGGAESYARASMYFEAIVKRKGVRGLMDVYDALNAGSPDFFSAVATSLRWDRERLEAEAISLIE